MQTRKQSRRQLSNQYIYIDLKYWYLLRRSGGSGLSNKLTHSIFDILILLSPENVTILIPTEVCLFFSQHAYISVLWHDRYLFYKPLIASEVQFNTRDQLLSTQQ